jgi:hypothetical protein
MCNRLWVISGLFAVVCVSQAEDYIGNDWQYNFDGHYSIANVDGTNNGIIANVLGATLNLTAQLNLINGTTSATNYGTTISQSSLTSMTVNDLRTTAGGSGGLVSALGTFVFNLLDFSDGIYAGTMSGTDVTLTRGSLLSADLFALVDTRVLGTGIVLDLRASIPTAQLDGNLTGINPLSQGPFGDQAYFIDGEAGLMQTIALEARARVFALNIATVDTGYLQVGAINNFADSWSLSRQPVPEPASIAAVGLGLLALVRRKRKA